MAYAIEKVDVWMGFVDDVPDAGEQVLAVLAKAGVNLEFMFSRPWKDGKVVLFLAPLKGAKALKAAQSVGIQLWSKAIRVKGPDKRGVAVKIAAALGKAGINISGFTAMKIGAQCMCYVAVDKENVAKALTLLKKAF